jgi:Zn-dependent metalloprotease
MPAPGGVPRTDEREIRVSDSWQQLKQDHGPGLQVRFRPQHGGAMYVSGNLSSTSNRAHAAPATTGIPRSPAEQTARAFLSRYHDLFLLEDPDSELRLVGHDIDEQGLHSLRFAQQFRGHTVWPAELIARVNADGDLYLIEGTQVATPVRAAAEPRLSAEDAIARVKTAYPFAAQGNSTAPELIVFAPLDQAPRLAWKLDLTVGLLNAWNYIIDADNGAILRRTSLVVDAAAQGSGKDVTGTTRSLNLWQDGATYYAVDTSKAMFDPGSAPPNNGRGVIAIYDGANKKVEDTQFSSGLVKSTSATSGWLPDAVGSAWGLAATYDYYQARFKRNSLDGQGGKISSIVRYDLNLANAFYINQTKTMVFGDSETKFIEVTGHELTHGVSANTGNGGILEYQGQSGALNESLSDIFGNMVKLYATGAQDWKIRLFDGGQDKVIRDFKEPNNVSNGGIVLPKNMSQYANLGPDQDHGGVHVNSSINNHAFYLAAEGLPDALGLADAEQIFYRAQTMHLQKQSQFIDMRLAAVSAAQELFGADSKQVQRIKQAYDGVEIFDAPDSPAPAPSPTINAPDSTLFIGVGIFGDLYLARREAAAGDSALGTILNTGLASPAGKRISITGDGSLAVFVTSDNDIGLVKTDGGGSTVADVSGTVHSIAISPDGNRVAVVLLDPVSGLPNNEIDLFDLASGKTTAVKLFSPAQDGNQPLDIIKYADSMVFLPDGQRIIYDAFAEIPLQNGGSFSGWGIYALDFAHEQILTLINLNDGLDFGNPALGKSHPNLLAFEVVDRKTGVSTIYSSDLSSGTAKPVGQLTQRDVYGFPSYAGDDRAIIYGQVDLSTFTTISLLRQGLNDDGITPAGNPTLWLSNADFAAVYRRGKFVAQNTPPTVAIVSPNANQTFTAPASIPIQITATDVETGIAKVDLYIGSTLVAEATQAPYNFTLKVDATPNTPLQLIARATDTLGAEANSTPVVLNFGPPNAGKSKLAAQFADGLLRLRVTGIAANDRVRIQASNDLKSWTTIGNVVSAGTETSFVDSDSEILTRRYYRTILNP